MDYKSIESALEVLDHDFCEYIILGYNINYRRNPYSINNICSFVPVRINPYTFLYSTSTWEIFEKEPEPGHTYLSAQIFSDIKAKRPYLGQTFSLGDVEGRREYIFDDRIAIDNFEMIVSLDDFITYDKVSFLVYSYSEGTPLSVIVKTNEKLEELFPGVECEIKRGLPESKKGDYYSNISYLSIFMFACVVSCGIIYIYIVGERKKDFSVMRLFGIKRHHVFLSIMLELFIYNFIAYAITLSLFIAWWLISNGNVSIWLHIKDALFIIGLLSIFCFITSIILALYLSRKIPSAYKTM